MNLKNIRKSFCILSVSLLGISLFAYSALAVSLSCSKGFMHCNTHAPTCENATGISSPQNSCCQEAQFLSCDFAQKGRDFNTSDFFISKVNTDDLNPKAFVAHAQASLFSDHTVKDREPESRITTDTPAYLQNLNLLC